MATIITLSTLETAARKAPGSLADKPYAAYVVEEASAIVCDIARHPEWEVDVVAPRTARRIAMSIAVRALLNPELEIAWNAGPVGGRNRDEWAFGFEPTPYEREQLEGLQGSDGTGGNGLWVQPTSGGDASLLSVYLTDPWFPLSTPILYQDEGDVGTDPLPEVP